MSVQSTKSGFELPRTNLFSEGYKSIISEDVSRIEIKQREILEQCYQNEELKKYNYNPSIVDCSLLNENSSPSLINKPHLNISHKCYQFKSETTVKKKTGGSLKKLRDSMRKLRIKKSSLQNNAEISLPLTNHSQATNSIHDNLSLKSYPIGCAQNNNTSDVPSNLKNMNQNIDTLVTETYSSNNQNNEDEEKILTRLFTRPNKKPLIKKLLEKVGGQSYSTRNIQKMEEHGKYLRRSSSNRSIPDALRELWSKVQRTNVDDRITSKNTQHLSKTRSMPQISDNFNYVNEHPLAFQNTCHNISRKKVFNSGPLYFAQPNKSAIKNKKTFKKLPENNSSNLVSNIGSSKRSSSSCSDLSSNKSHFFNPEMVYGPYLIAFHRSNENIDYAQNFHSSPHELQYQYGVEGFHCPCCQHNTPKTQYQPAFRERAVAPLNIQIASEKRATRRKVSDMVFDSFV